MKAQILNTYGDADAFTLEDVEIREPGAGELRVRVRAIGINPMEANLRNGDLKDEMPLQFPAILGTDFAGEVEAVGDGVETLAVGSRVAGLSGQGAYAEFVVVSEDAVTELPSELTFEQGATLPTAGESAQRALALLHPEAGETVVVNGAAGSVGSAAVQLLVRDSVRVVGTASENNHDYVRGLGADPVAYGEGVAERIDKVSPGGVDAVLDVAGHDFVDTAINLLGGPDRIVTLSDFGAGSKGVTVASGDPSRITAVDFERVVDLAATGDFQTEVAQEFAFEDLADAHRLSESGHLRGKIIVAGP